MKKIHKLLIQAFVRPFIVTFFIVMFILLMFFLFKYVDDLVGKGFEWYTILELMFYASASNVAMALPLAVLLSSIMTFGTLGENYELVAIKSAGVSLQKAMMPLLVVILMLAVGSFAFSEYMLPKANLKYGSLLYDVTNKKLAFLIKEGVFNNSVPGYSIRVDKKYDDGRLEGLMIYQRNPSNDIANVIMAKEGEMKKTPDGSFIVLKMKDAVRYQENPGKNSYASPRQEFTRMRFKETEEKLDFSSFKMNRTDENSFSTNDKMLNLAGLKKKTDSLSRDLDSVNRFAKTSLGSYFKQNNFTKGYTKLKVPVKVVKGSVLNSVPRSQRTAVTQNALDIATAIQQSAFIRIGDHDEKIRNLIKVKIEYQRKFTLAASCILLFFIGAPLGAIIRKGGLGLPVVMAIIFFLIYHIISTVAEKSTVQGNISPVLGIWLAIIILSPLAVFLTYKATVDSALFDLSYYKGLVQQIFKRFKSQPR
ncbi:MAG: YjgP/YjgQ family permease [Pedobacter sp.]|nr:MAG: YjgP/YjgQ family permease [Pedobacter sp.]